MSTSTFRQPSRLHPSLLALTLACALAALSGCGGGGDAAAPSPTPTPPAPGATSYTVAVTVATVGAGEVFKFALAGQSISVVQGGTATAFATALAGGSSYTVSQTDGPRSCTLSANRSGSISANVSVTADCGTPPALSTVKGTLYTPVGTQLTLQNNAADDLTLTMAPFAGSTDVYNQQAFAFATAQLDGSAYAVSLKTTPANQSCSVFKNATGTLPTPAGTVHVGCEFTFDHLSRNDDSSVRGTYFDSSAPVVGGAAGAVGSTPDGYGEGRFVAFVSSAAGIGRATGAKRQVFWRDRLTGTTRLISTSGAGTEGNGDSFAPAISADGLWVVFESHASNLVAGDANGVRDIFLWSAQDPSPGVRRVSVGAGGVEANSESYEPTLSGDGKVVAFSSGASNLTPGVVGTSTINVYRRDLASGSNTLVSAAAGSGVGGARPMLSEDGNRLAFWSFAANLVAGDGNGLWDIFVYDHAAASLARVSLTNGGGERDQGSESASRVVAPALSGNGRFVAYASTATNLVAGDSNGVQDVFVVDTQTGAVQRASIGTAGAQGNADSPVGQGERPSLSYDGSWVGFSTNASNLGVAAGNAVMHNLLTGETRALSNVAGSGVGPVALSRSANYAVFGAANPLDPRFTSTGLFARFTGVGRAWWWID